MTKTDIANLALSKIGEPIIEDIADSGDRIARLASLHYEPTLREVLRAHFWGFAMVASQSLESFAGDAKASVTLFSGVSDKGLFIEAVNSGTAGNEITVEIAAPADSSVIGVSVSASSILLTPATKMRMVISALNVAAANGELQYAGIVNGYPAWSTDGTMDATADNTRFYHDGAYWKLRLGPSAPYLYEAHKASAATFPDGLTGWTLISPVVPSGGFPTITAGDPSLVSELVAAINADSAASLLVAAENEDGSDGSAEVTALAATALSGGSSSPPGWDKAFLLPADFIKLRRVLTEDGGRIDKFEFRRINGERCMVTDDYDAVVLEYVAFVDDPGDYDPLFVEAFVTLLAAKLARAITGSEATEADLRQLYETNALPAARTADSHDTRSAENRPIDNIIGGSLLRRRGDFMPDLDDDC